MAAPDLVNLSGLMDDAKCFALVCQHRWPEGICCPGCDSSSVIRDGCDDTQPHRQRYRCKACAGRFDDLTGTVLAGHHQPLRVWVLCLYFMGLNNQLDRKIGELLLREHHFPRRAVSLDVASLVESASACIDVNEVAVDQSVQVPGLPCDERLCLRLQYKPYLICCRHSGERSMGRSKKPTREGSLSTNFGYCINSSNGRGSYRVPGW